MPSRNIAPAPPLAPPDRLLCGPGPTNIEPSVLDAMRESMLGHLDPAFHELMLELIEMLRAVYGVEDGVALPLQATGMSGMEMAGSGFGGSGGAARGCGTSASAALSAASDRLILWRAAMKRLRQRFDAFSIHFPTRRPSHRAGSRRTRCRRA